MQGSSNGSGTDVPAHDEEQGVIGECKDTRMTATAHADFPTEVSGLPIQFIRPCSKHRNELWLNPHLLGIHRSHSPPFAQSPSVRNRIPRLGHGWRWCALWRMQAPQAPLDRYRASVRLSRVPRGNGLRKVSIIWSRFATPLRIAASSAASTTAVRITKKPRAFPLPEK